MCGWAPGEQIYQQVSYNASLLVTCLSKNRRALKMDKLAQSRRIYNYLIMISDYVARPLESRSEC